MSSHLNAVTARTGTAERAAIHNFDKIWSKLVPDNRLRPWGLAKFMTELRKSDDANARPASYHDAMTLLRFWHYAQHDLDKLEINKDRFREWWINEVCIYRKESEGLFSPTNHCYSLLLHFHLVCQIMAFKASSKGKRREKACINSSRTNTFKHISAIVCATSINVSKNNRSSSSSTATPL
jgi:hypothetical protein